MEQDFPGGSSLIRKAFELKNIPQQSIDILLSSIAPSTLKQYESCFKKWWKFCSKNKVNPFQNDVPIVIRFLTDVFINERLSSSSIGCYRSALALIIGSELASDSRMTRFITGVQKLRPSMPRYDSTWNPKIVLDLFLSWDCNDKLTITLLALVTGHRMQTFSLIKIENIPCYEDSLEIKSINQNLGKRN